MTFETSRAKALNQLNNFIDNGLAEYSKLRNFDFGPEKRTNISCLSPYITHGIINEKEVIQKALSKFSFSKNEKFIQEVLWRTYWKGWLETHPWIYDEYLNTSQHQPLPKKTGIKCFDYWKEELLDTGYLSLIHI